MALSGKVVLLIGGASGIGLATSRKLLQEGASLVVGDVAEMTGEKNVKELQKQFGANRVIFLRVDICSDQDVEAAFDVTMKHYKKLDIFINCAAILNDFKWNLEVDINFKGVVRGTLMAWKYMGKHEGGRGGTIINIASQLGLETSPGTPIYAATKHAVVGFSRSCGEQFHLDRTGVRVITICPGLTLTPLVEKTKELRMLSKELEEECFRAITTFPPQQPEDVARGVVYVLQHGASGSVWMSEGGEDVYELAMPPRLGTRVAH